jgi:hypothetical protein
MLMSRGEESALGPVLRATNIFCQMPAMHTERDGQFALRLTLLSHWPRQ